MTKLARAKAPLAATALVLCAWAIPVFGAEKPANGASTPARTAEPDRNADASEAICLGDGVNGRAGGLVDIAPDGTGSTAGKRDCIVLSGVRKAAQIGRSIEVSDRATGPASAPGTATADSASYALSLVNVRPDWATSALTGEADGLSVFVRQARGDTAAILSNVGVRSGFAATLESYTFAADEYGQPTRAVRTQLGVVNSRDGGEFGLLVQAADGKELHAGLRIASLGSATWRNYLEILDPVGETITSIRGSDGAFIGGDLLPSADLRKTIGSPHARYAATYTQVLQLAQVLFSQLPECRTGTGIGTLAFISDGPETTSTWGQVVSRGGGKSPVFVKCDGRNWKTF